MTTRELFTMSTSSGSRLVGTLDLPAGNALHPTIVACHGFKGFMEWGFFPALAELLAQRGFAVIRFNFSGSGMQPGDELVTDLEAFRHNTISREVEELLDALTAVGDSLAPGRADPDHVGLFGHSRGGGVALLAAATPEWQARLQALVTWAAVGTFDRITTEQKAQWRRDGEFPFVNSRTGQELPLGLGLLDDIEHHSAALNLSSAAARRQAPWLIVHGDADDTVPASEGSELFAAARDRKEFLSIAGGDHGFGGRHPFKGPTPQLVQAMNATQSWFRRYLG